MRGGGEGGWPRSGVLAAGRWWLAAWSWLVPSSRREEWRAEWEAELWQLWRRATRSPDRYGGRTWGVAWYLAGAPWSVIREIEEEWMRDLWQDIRYGVRTLGRAPGYLAVAVVTLALGIGANTTVFTLVNGLLLQEPAGIQAPERLVRIGRGHAPERFDNWSYPVYRDFRERADWFAGVAGFAGAGSAIIGRGVDAEAVPAQLVSDNYFDVLGVRPVVGREFVPEETATAGAAPVVVISHALWRRRFGGSRDAVGGTLAVNGRDYRVIGVAPEGFRGSDVFRPPADVWLPASMIADAFGPGAESMLERRSSSWFWVFARLDRDVTFEAAAEATRTLYARFDEENPDLAGQGIWLVEGIGLTPGDREDTLRMSRLLLGIVLLVLLIACANLAGLGLARGAARRGEVGVRTALGASRARVVRQLLTESLLVALAGGIAALGITAVAARHLPAVVPFSLSVDFAPGLPVLVFGVAAAAAAGILFGLLPALRAARADIRHALSGSRTGTSRSGTRVRRGLVAFQLALSFVLLAGTGVLLRSLYNARTVDPGFAADRVATIDLDVGMRGGYDEAAGRAFYDRLREAAAAVPGVEAAGLVAELPVVDFQSNHTPIAPDEVRDPDTPPAAPVLSNYADAGYFDAIGLTLLAGRTFQPGDHGENAERVAVIDRTLAERFFGDRSPVGEPLPFMADPDWDERTRVIGVVSAHSNRGLRQPPRAAYWIPFDRAYRGDMTLVARTDGDPAALIPALADVVQEIDPGMPLLRTGTLRDLVGGTLRETRMVGVLIAVFGVIALLLAAVGLYGVMAYTVARRTREMGVRIAIGATARDVLGLVIRQGLAVAVVGLALGLAGAIAALRLLRGMLFDVAPADPVTLTLGAATLLAVAVAATFLPARRATRIEPVTALKEE